MTHLEPVIEKIKQQQQDMSLDELKKEINAYNPKIQTKK